MPRAHHGTGKERERERERERESIMNHNFDVNNDLIGDRQVTIKAKVVYVSVAYE